jgi:hypothetical protein
MAAVYAAETQNVARTHTGQVAFPVFGSFGETDLAVVWSPATAATLRLLTRQQLRAQLRC